MLGGLKQEQLATRWKLTDRQVRTHIGRAADELARWMQERLHADDLAALATLAKDKGVVLDLEMADIRGLFSHLSRQKRLRALLILSLIYKRESGSAAGTPLTALSVLAVHGLSAGHRIRRLKDRRVV